MRKNKSAEPEISRDDLVAVATELNELMGLEPAIDVSDEAEDSEILELVKEAAGELKADDELSEETTSALEALGFLTKKPVVKKPEVRRPAKKVEPEEEPDEEPEPKEEKAEKPKKAPKPKKEKVQRVGRSEILAEVLQKIPAKGATKDTIVKQSSELFASKNNTEDTGSGAKVQFEINLGILIALGILEKKDDLFFFKG